MKLEDLRKVVPDETTIWLQDSESGDYLTANEFRYIDNEFDNCEITSMYPEKYPSISTSGITVFINYYNKE